MMINQIWPGLVKIFTRPSQPQGARLHITSVGYTLMKGRLVIEETRLWRQQPHPDTLRALNGPLWEARRLSLFAWVLDQIDDLATVEYSSLGLYLVSCQIKCAFQLRHLTINGTRKPPSRAVKQEEISALLGYTEGTNFRRTFKLWTGHPPSYFRPA